ncbi:hypothetical protein SEVIR_3G130095v4 [Setaria viridis]
MPRAAGGVGSEEGAGRGDAPPVLADGAAAEHGLGGEADEDLQQSVVAQGVDASWRVHVHLLLRRRSRRRVLGCRIVGSHLMASSFVFSYMLVNSSGATKININSLTCKLYPLYATSVSNPFDFNGSSLGEALT